MLVKLFSSIQVDYAIIVVYFQDHFGKRSCALPTFIHHRDWKTFSLPQKTLNRLSRFIHDGYNELDV